MQLLRARSSLTVRNALLLTTLVSIVPALLVIVVTGIEHGQFLEEAIRLEARRQAEAIAEMQEQSADALIQMLDTIAHMSAFREERSEEQLEIMKVALQQNTRLLNMTVTDVSGRVTVSPGLEAGTDLSYRRHIQDALRTGRAVTGEYILARIDEIPSFPYSVPIRSGDGSVIGTLNVVYPLNSYADLFRRLELPEGTILGMTDRHGIRVYFHPPMESNPVGSPIKEDVWEAISTSPTNSGVVRTTGSDGVGRFYAFRRIVLHGDDDPYMNVVVGFPEVLAVRPARKVLYRNILLVAAALGVAMVTAVGLGKLVFTRHVEQLVGTARSIERGDYAVRTGIPAGRSEISFIAGAIDEMAGRLEERSAERAREAERLSRSLREKEVLLKEIHHRVKNNMQLILSIVRLQRNSTDSPPDADISDQFYENLESRISAIAGVHEMLYQSPDLSTIEMQPFLENLVHLVAYGHDAPRVTIDAGDIALRIEVAVPLSLITSELLVNSRKYGGRDGRGCNVAISLHRQGETLVLTVDDDGPGFPDGHRPQAGKGLGYSLVEALTSQLAGTVEVWSDRGAHIRLEIHVPGGIPSTL